jgi:hypothetical protein
MGLMGGAGTEIAFRWRKGEGMNKKEKEKWVLERRNV